jgi:hypothetical protein
MVSWCLPRQTGPTSPALAGTIRSRRRVHFLDWVSLNQSYHPAPLYSVKGEHDVVPVEYGQEMFHRSGSVARPALNIFPQDASSVLNGTN